MKLFHRIFIPLVTILNLILGQSVLLNENENAIEISLSTIATQETTLKMFTIGFALAGRLDYNLSFGNTSDIEPPFTVIGHSLGLYTKNVNSGANSTLGVILGYQTESPNDASSGNRDIQMRTITFNQCKYLATRSNNHMSIISIAPSIGMVRLKSGNRNYNNGRFTSKEIIIASISLSTIQSWSISESMIIAIQLGAGQSYIIETQSGDTSIGVGISFVQKAK